MLDDVRLGQFLGDFGDFDAVGETQGGVADHVLVFVFEKQNDRGQRFPARHDIVSRRGALLSANRRHFHGSLHLKSEWEKDTIIRGPALFLVA